MTDKDKFVYLMEFHWKEVSIFRKSMGEKNRYFI